MKSNTLPQEQQEGLLQLLKARFEKNKARHQEIEWTKVEARLKSSAAGMWSLHEMERTGGEPDLVYYDKKTGACTFFDCAAESPKGRRSVCYDRQALEERKEHKPGHSAVEMAKEMGIELLTEQQYRQLQSLGTFDAKTSSWIQTPADIRKFGGALFGDFRYGHVFIYHNGASSYYAARGFRGALTI
ncbi:MAG: DUF4256 domain-containing protein [Chitinophagaceae bacterium]